MTTTHQQWNIKVIFTQILIVIGVLLFAPYTLLITGSNVFPQAFAKLGLIVVYWQFILSWLLFSYKTTYLITCIGFAILAAIMMAVTGFSSFKRLIALATILLMVSFFVFAPYHTAAVAANGYKMIVPTSPSLFYRGLRNAQVLTGVDACSYELLGWEKEVLYYRSKCPGNIVKTFQFDPAQTAKPQETTDFLSVDQPYIELLKHKEMLAYVRVENVYPIDAEYSVRSLSVLDSGFLSPDGKWLALITQHLYSVQDVAVIKIR